MKVEYKGHKVEVKREKSLAGYSMLYYSVFRSSDGYECLSSCEDSDEKVREKIKQLKDLIDHELSEDDPWCELEGRVSS